MKRIHSAVLATLAGLCLSAGLHAADYSINWYSLNAGGGASSSASYHLDASIGQPSAGFSQSTSLLHWAGFWAGDVPAPTVTPTAASAKMLPDGTFVSVAGKIATSTESDFAGFFYLEEPDRSGGIRVLFPAGTVAGLERDRSVVNVIGTMGTAASGERQVSASVIIIVSTNPQPLAPLGMGNRSIGGGDLGTLPLGQCGISGGSGLNNVGLLIRTWGLVSYADGSYMLISDGSGASIKVSTSGLANLPKPGQYIGVIGISSLDTSGTDRVPLILPREGSDLTSY